MTLLANTFPETARFRAYGPRHAHRIAGRFGLPAEVGRTVEAIARVLPFRVNEYVLTELIDWAAVPADPIFQLVFPQRGMIPVADELRLAGPEWRAAVGEVRARMNPHPSGQRELNVPTVDGVPIPGLQHKYRETVLYFPSHGQSCHSYCTYCFRWAQFVGDADLRFAAPDLAGLVDYLRSRPHVTDVLVTGGDPMVMATERLREHLTPILGVATVETIRIGTKSVAYWPHRFVTDHDADDLLRLFEDVVATGRTLAVMAHFTHPRELETGIARQALARIRSTGAVIYCQAPMVAHVNDDAPTWARMWRAQLGAGAVPYYMFVERDTGPYGYFKVPLARAVEIFHAAYRNSPGLARTVRGPVMSATPGKVVLDGVEETSDGRFFQLRMLRARNPALAGRPFRARYSTSASWLTELSIDEQAPPDIAAALGNPGPAEGSATDGQLEGVAEPGAQPGPRRAPGGR